MHMYVDVSNSSRAIYSYAGFALFHVQIAAQWQPKFEWKVNPQYAHKLFKLPLLT